MFGIRTLSRSGLAAAGLVTMVAATLPGPRAGLRLHTRLIKSEPAANDTLAHPPGAVRLWFSEQVELPVTSVKLTDEAGGAIALVPLARPDTGKTAPVVAALSAPLAAGSYVVAWRTAARDGHPANGTFGFVVKAAF
jgi:methionine-rich copper-binding protein CopC